MKNLLFLSFVVLFIAGCWSCKKTTHRSLKNTSWEMISIRDIPKTRIGSMDRKPVIHFTDSATVHGNAGCNNFFGTFETEGSHVTFGPLGATMMFCENMDVEDVFFKTMPEIGRYEIVRDTLLRLLDKTGGQSIEFRKISNR